MKTLYSILGLLLLAFVEPLLAMPILQPVSATSSVGQLSATTGPEKLIDQSGLSATYTSGVTDFASFTATTTFSNTGGGKVWLAGDSTQPPADLDFDLGSVANIDGLALWNGDGLAAVNGFSLIGSLLADFSNPTNLGSFSALNLSSPVDAQTFSFAATTARYVRLTITSNFGSTRFAAGIGEIAFREASAAPVPEPSTVVLMGFGLVGLGFTRRKMKT